MKSKQSKSLNSKLIEKLGEVQQELAELKRQNIQVKMLKEAEKKHQSAYITNCIKVLHIVKDKQKDYALESMA
jgi:hypothetical protein